MNWSSLVIPLLLAGIALYGTGKRVDVYAYAAAAPGHPPGGPDTQRRGGVAQTQEVGGVCQSV